jgi:cellulose synthase/poly-beta-1,6-N-acetylglucosamine synthase-like glycosyltransferase
MNEYILSVVVIGRNEGQRLKRCLASLAAVLGLGGEMEIIYVDSGSTDGSPGVASAFGAQVIVLNVERPTAAQGRNAGWPRAHAAYVLFLDGDTVLDPDFPKTALTALLENDSIAGVWGHRRELYPEHSIYNRVLDLDWIYPPGDSEFCGGDVLMRRSALEEVNGYDPALIAGEEPELCRRLRARGHRIVHIDSPMTGHDLAMTSWGQYWRRATRCGHAYAELSERFRSSDDPLWLAESRANLKRGGFWLLTLATTIVALPWSPIPLLASAALVFLLAARSGWNARWKVPSDAKGRVALLFAYGIHSHLQQIPICIGQLRYYLDRRAGKRRNLIEYRGPSSM